VPAALNACVARNPVGYRVGSGARPAILKPGRETATGVDDHRLSRAVQRDRNGLIRWGLRTPPAMWPLTVTVAVPELTAGTLGCLKAGVALVDHQGTGADESV